MNNTPFLAFLEAHGHVRARDQLPRTDSHSYREAEFSPEFIAGMVAHSLLSSWPQRNFYTDGKTVFFQDDGRLISDLTQEHREAIVREDLVLEALSSDPKNPSNLYGAIEDRVRVVNFSDCFHGNGQIDTPYQRFYKETTQDVSDGVIGLWREIEWRNIRGRTQKNRQLIAAFLDAMRQDVEPYPTFAHQLETQLHRFGYEHQEAQQEH